MPYIENERKILTKVIGVNTKVDHKDDRKVRQVVLQEIEEDPTRLSIIFLKKHEVWVKLISGREFYLGDVKAKYGDQLRVNAAEIVSWKITGGYELPAKTIEIAGNDYTKQRSIRASRGMNIGIKLL